jgi:outer membrane protein TolC
VRNRMEVEVRKIELQNRGGCGLSRILSTALVLPILCLPLAGQPLRVEQVLRSSAAKVERENTRVPLLEANMQLLKSMAKRRLEFRPNLGLFSFSNPLLLAATIGSGLTYQNSRVSPQTLEAATHDLLAARIALERSKVRAQIDAARSFFDLVEKQETEKARCEASSLRQQQQQSVRLGLVNGSLTALDVASFQNVVLDAEGGCSDARSQRKLASYRLAYVLGEDEISTDPVAEPEFKLADYRQPVPVENVFHEMAFRFREDLQWIDREIASLKQTAKPTVKSRLASVPASIDYRFVSKTAQGAGSTNYLLGGNTVHLQLPWSIPLTKTNEREAGQILAAARILALEAEARSQRREIRQEVNAMVVEAQAARERIELAGRKRDLAVESRQLLAARVEAGLTGGDALLSTPAFEAAVRESEASVNLANSHWKAALYSLYVACGVHEQHEAALAAVNVTTDRVSGGGGGQ